MNDCDATARASYEFDKDGFWIYPNFSFLSRIKKEET